MPDQEDHFLAQVERNLRDSGWIPALKKARKKFKQRPAATPNTTPFSTIQLRYLDKILADFERKTELRVDAIIAKRERDRHLQGGFRD